MTRGHETWGAFASFFYEEIGRRRKRDGHLTLFLSSPSGVLSLVSGPIWRYTLTDKVQLFPPRQKVQEFRVLAVTTPAAARTAVSADGPRASKEQVWRLSQRAWFSQNSWGTSHEVVENIGAPSLTIRPSNALASLQAFSLSRTLNPYRMKLTKPS